MNGALRTRQPEWPTPAAVPRGGIGTAAHHGAPIRLLVFTNLYPNAAQPRRGLFVEERVRRLCASGRFQARVMAPVPWFPFRHRCFGAYAEHARVPAREVRHGIEIVHPRYPVIPKVGMAAAPALLYHAMLPACRAMQRDGHAFDLIDAHYFYPDGVAALRLGRVLRRPVVVTARGSDINIIGAHRGAARRMVAASRDAAALIAVSDTLRQRMQDMDMGPAPIDTLRNGVDLERFCPRPRVDARQRLGIRGVVWLAVGNLIELKGVHITVAALSMVPDATLLVVGDGPEAGALRRLAAARGVAERVRFVGAVAPAVLPGYYNAADALVLASSHEGMPNVVLESLACGTPVVAAPFAGASDLLCSPQAGEVAAARSVPALAAAWRRLAARTVDRHATRRVAERLGWAPVIAAQAACYQQVLAQWMAVNPEHRP